MAAVAFFGILIILFGVAVASPHAAGKIKRRSRRKISRLKQLSNWLWDPLTWWAKSSLDLTRKSIAKTVLFGRELRRKLPF